MVLQQEVAPEVRWFMLYMARTAGWDVEEAVYFLEKPWKWQPEFDAWMAAGMPEGRGDESGIAAVSVRL